MRTWNRLLWSVTVASVVVVATGLGPLPALGQSACMWTGPVTLPADGVLNCTTLTVPSGSTVTFIRNVANTPVTILATGDVTIAGTIDLSGGAGGDAAAQIVLAHNGGRGGPGGGNGGTGGNGLVSWNGGRGLGPGGGLTGTFNPDDGSSAGFATPGVRPSQASVAGGPAYGTPTLLPLVGGSGGAGSNINVNGWGRNGSGGGGGGGALLISAPAHTISLTGTILANGGMGGRDTTFLGLGRGGGGSGGAVRLVANRITGFGTINIAGGINGIGGTGRGGAGRVRVEFTTSDAAFTITGHDAGAVSTGAQPGPPQLANNPTLKIQSVAGITAPTTPSASYGVPDIVVPASCGGPTTCVVSVTVAGSNIPLGTNVALTVVGQNGFWNSATTGGLAGTLASSRSARR